QVHHVRPVTTAPREVVLDEREVPAVLAGDAPGRRGGELFDGPVVAHVPAAVEGEQRHAVRRLERPGRPPTVTGEQGHGFAVAPDHEVAIAGEVAGAGRGAQR